MADPVTEHVDYSEDGKWWWDGRTWHPLDAEHPGPGETPDLGAGADSIQLGQITFSEQSAAGVNTRVKMKNTTAQVVREPWLHLVATPLSGQSQGATEYWFETDDLAPGEEKDRGGPIQLDPGDWSISFVAVDRNREVLSTQTGEPLHIDGIVVHERAGHGATEALSLRPAFTDFESHGGMLVVVRYQIANEGSQPAPPGTPVWLTLVSTDADGGENVGEQHYQLQRGIPVGTPIPRHLTVQGVSTPGATFFATLVVDPSGPNESVTRVQGSWGEGGAVSFEDA